MPSCETDGHVFGERNICVMCKEAKPATAPIPPFNCPNCSGSLNPGTIAMSDGSHRMCEMCQGGGYVIQQQAPAQNERSCDACGNKGTDACPHCQATTCGKCAVCEHGPIATAPSPTPERVRELIQEATGRQAYASTGDDHGIRFWRDTIAALERLQSLEKTCAEQEETIRDRERLLDGLRNELTARGFEP